MKYQANSKCGAKYSDLISVGASTDHTVQKCAPSGTPGRKNAVRV